MRDIGLYLVGVLLGLTAALVIGSPTFRTVAGMLTPEQWLSVTFALHLLTSYLIVVPWYSRREWWKAYAGSAHVGEYIESSEYQHRLRPMTPEDVYYRDAFGWLPPALCWALSPLWPAAAVLYWFDRGRQVLMYGRGY